jgi:NAD(P)-dependent dehydrogenase (short-subunit alcohol dehydrogenase family)
VEEDDMDLTGASAIVTGGAGGFGSATVRRLVDAGARVVIADLAEEKATALATELGDAVRFVKTDVTSEESVGAAIAAAAELGPLRVAVVVHGGPAAGARVLNRAGETYGLDVFRRTIEIFLTGTFNVLSQAAKQMATNEPLDSGQRGVVITTASIAGFEGQPGQSDYSAAKGGVIGLNLTAARDLAPLGIRVMCIAPGTFLTPAYPDPVAAEAAFGPTVPNPKRMGRADEYAQLALQIVENDYLNGEVIRIDGALRFNVR